jgi:hypothetical protein
MIDLDPRVRDAWGLPAPRMTYDWRRPNELARAEFMMKKIEEIGRAMGATQVWRAPQGSGAPAGHHEGGTRMGNDPKTSVVNRYGQSWDIPESLRRRQLDLPLAKQLQSNAHDPGARLYERRCDCQSLPEEPGIAAIAIRRNPVIAAGLTRNPSLRPRRRPTCCVINRFRATARPLTPPPPARHCVAVRGRLRQNRDSTSSDSALR